MEQARSAPVGRIRWVMVAVDASIVLISYLVVLVFRFDGEVPDRFWAHFWWFVPFAILAHVLMNFALGLYSPAWQYRRLIVGGIAAGMILIVGGVYFAPVNVLPLSVLGLGALVSTAGFALARASRGELRRVLRGAPSD